MNYTFKKGAGGAGGLAFRMQLYADNSFETKGSGTNYIAVGVTGAGVLAVSKVEDGAWARICGDIALAKLPQGWQDKMNAAQTDAEVTVNITVRDYGSYFEIYLDGSLAYTCESMSCRLKCWREQSFMQLIMRKCVNWHYVLPHC